MKNMTKFIALSAMTLAISAVACGDDETGTGGGTSTGATTSTGGGGTGGTGGGTGGMGGNDAPPPPTLGTQIDRMGRPAVATATYARFIANDDGSMHAAATDTWNADSDPTSWAGSYAGPVAQEIAVLDALDAAVAGPQDTGCGNQLVYANPLAPATCPADGNVACYGLLGTILANDWLLLKVNGADDSGYLGVESNFVAGMGDSKGGRMPAHDVIDTSYTVLAGIPFGDGVPAPAQSQVESFPYLAAPN